MNSTAFLQMPILKVIARAIYSPSGLAWYEWGQLLGVLLAAVSAIARLVPYTPAMVVALCWHVFCDFTCQWNRLAAAKARKRLWALVIHGVIAGGLPMVLTGCVNPWIIGFAILAHSTIDATGKFGLREPWGPIADQMAHALCIGLCVGFMTTV